MTALITPALSLASGVTFIALTLWRPTHKPATQWLAMLAVGAALLALNVADWQLNGSGWSGLRTATWTVVSMAAVFGLRDWGYDDPDAAR